MRKNNKIRVCWSNCLVRTLIDNCFPNQNSYSLFFVICFDRLHPVMASSILANDNERVKEAIVDARISKILALRTDSIAMTEALDAIGEFYVISTTTIPLLLFFRN